MKGTITIFHPDEDLEYQIDKGLCKVVWEEGNSTLLIETESTEDLHEVEEDSIQNDYPKIALTVEDVVIDFKDRAELEGQTISIPKGTEELEDEHGEMYKLNYTTLYVEELDEKFETFNNHVSFLKVTEGFRITWKGSCEDFYTQGDTPIQFSVEAMLIEAKEEDLSDFED